MTQLPSWAVVPVDMDSAAMLLGVSRRYLIDVIKEHPHYDRRGVRKVFYPEHIAALREAMSCQTSPSKAVTASGSSMEPLPDGAFEKALALATAKSQNKSSSNTKRGSGKVLSMVRVP